MTEIQPFLPQSSPFDAIRRVRPDGSEYWSARDLMQPLGYMRWDGFVPSVERAMAAGSNSGIDVPASFAQVAKVRRDPKLGDVQRYDYELSRFACYLVAMNGDPRKPEIAAAQTYFAVRTREAETARPRELSRKQLAQMVIEAEEALEAERERADRAEFQAIEMAPAARAWDTFREAHGDYSAREAAQILSRDPRIEIGQNRLFKYLREVGWIDHSNLPYQAQIKCGRLALRTSSWENPSGEEQTSRQARVTVKGIEELHKLLGGGAQFQALMAEEVAA